MGGAGSSPQPKRVEAGLEVLCLRKGDRPFGELLALVDDDLQGLLAEVEEIERKHRHFEENGAVWPPALQETMEERFSRYHTTKRECARLEEILTRIQLRLDGANLPRVLNEDGEEVSDPQARVQRSSAIRQAEDLIGKLQKQREAVLQVEGQLESKL